ncbi:TPA_asm: P2 [Justicia betacytorhabdovirus 1]|nr:TPA_asm: P2 [Justicia betacytorhabdovirus 1]
MTWLYHVPNDTTENDGEMSEGFIIFLSNIQYDRLSHRILEKFVNLVILLDVDMDYLIASIMDNHTYKTSQELALLFIDYKPNMEMTKDDRDAHLKRYTRRINPETVKRLKTQDSAKTLFMLEYMLGIKRGDKNALEKKNKKYCCNLKHCEIVYLKSAAYHIIKIMDIYKEKYEDNKYVQL